MNETVQSPPTAIDYAYRVAYSVAHRLLRAYWGVRHPRKGGTLVAMWYDGKLLIVKNTYRKQHTLPGGYPRGGETPSQAGARELQEECGIRVRPEDVREVYRGMHRFEGREDDVTIVEVNLPAPPAVHIDNREVAYARLATPKEILDLLIVPHLRDYLHQKAAVGPAAPPPT